MSGELKRSLSLVGAVAMIVGVVVGGSIFVLVPTLAGMTGPSLYLAYIISVVPAIFTGLYLMQMGAALPVTGANYVAVTRWISPTAGFSISMAGMIAIVSTNCLVAWGFAKYITNFFPNIWVLGCAIGVILFFAFINWIGVKIFEWIQVIMFVVLITAMLIFGIAGMSNIQPEYQTPLFPNGVGKFIMVIAIATFSWAGIIAITEVAGEVKNPKRNIPIAIVVSLIIILIIYVLQTYVFTGTLLWSEASKIGDTAVIDAARVFLPGWLVTFVVIAALLAMATTVNALMLMATREILAWSRDGVIPAIFNRIGKRFSTPGFIILLIAVLSVIGVMFSVNLDKYALMVVFALMVIQGFGATAMWLMPKRAPEIYEKAHFQFSPFWRWFTWIGCIVLFTFIFLFGMLADLKTGIVFIGILIIGVIYWYIRRYYLQKRGVSIDEKMKEFSKESLMELEEV